MSPPVDVVLGAGGNTGLACVQRLLAVHGATGGGGATVRAVVRDPSKYAEKLPASRAGFEVVAGDVCDEASLRAALAGARSVIFAASGKGYWTPADVDFAGVRRVAGLAKELGVARVVLVSSALVTPKNWLHPIRMLLNNIRWRLMDNKLKGENALRASGVSYTIVRPGGLTNDEPGHARLVARQGDTSWNPGSVSRADVAAVCVEATTNPGAHNVTLELASEKPHPGAAAAAGQGGEAAAGGVPPLEQQVKQIWAGLKPDGQP